MLPEPMVQESVSAGVDVSVFSGDKLLGGPQAGILAGRRNLIAALREHALARAVRMDKMTIAALAATLQHYARGEELSEIPVWRMIATPVAALETRARAWAEAITLPAEIRPSRSMVGGGSLPEEGLETRVLCLRVCNPDAAAAALRGRTPALVARIEDGLLVLDPAERASPRRRRGHNRPYGSSRLRNTRSRVANKPRWVTGTPARNAESRQVSRPRPFVGAVTGRALPRAAGHVSMVGSDAGSGRPPI